MTSTVELPTFSKPAARERGFTLIELMIAAAVIAILAAVAIPSYKNYVTRGKLTQATGLMAGLATELQQYYQDNRTYVNACGTSGLAALPPASASSFTFSCTRDATTFLISASGNAGTNVAGFTYTLDQNGNRATTAAPTGWTTSASCWVLNQSGSCN